MTDTDLILARIEAKDDADRDRHDDIVRRLDVVESKVDKTNGRVSRLELWRHGFEAVAKAAAQKHGWRWPALISIVGAIVSGTVVALVAALIAQGG